LKTSLNIQLCHKVPLTIHPFLLFYYYNRVVKWLLLDVESIIFYRRKLTNTIPDHKYIKILAD